MNPEASCFGVFISRSSPDGRFSHSTPTFHLFPSLPISSLPFLLPLPDYPFSPLLIYTPFLPPLFSLFDASRPFLSVDSSPVSFYPFPYGHSVSGLLPFFALFSVSDGRRLPGYAFYVSVRVFAFFSLLGWKAVNTSVHGL